MTKSSRGFGRMTPDQLREISSRGGKAAHEQGTAHRFTPEEAIEAGRKGGIAPHARRGPTGPRKKPKKTDGAPA